MSISLILNILKGSKVNKLTTMYIKKIVLKFSSYQLTTEECTALPYALDHHIPCMFSSNIIHIEFQQFYQSSLFIELNHDPTKSIEGKIQRILRKFKNRLSSKEYYQLYPTVSCPGKFYGTSKI